jgi:maltoporin
VVYDEKFYSLYGEFQPRSGLYLSLFARFGDQVDFSNDVLAKVTRFRPQVRLNLGRHWQMELRHTYQQLDQDLGEIFTANQSDFRVAYQFDLRQRLRLTVQWTDVERNQATHVDEINEKFSRLGTQLIYSYKVNPRTVLFAGYSDSGQEDDTVDSLITTNRTLFMKIGYAWEPSF